MRHVLLATLALTACGRADLDGAPAASTDSPALYTTLTATNPRNPIAKAVLHPPIAPQMTSCDPQAEFGPLLADGEDTAQVYNVPTRYSADELTAYASIASGGTAADIFAATRSTVGAPFGAFTALSPLNLPEIEDRSPTVTADGLTLYFESYRLMYPHIYSATRATTSDPWSNVQLVAELDFPAIHYDFSAYVSADGEEIWFTSDRPDGNLPGDMLELWFSVKQNGVFTTPKHAAQIGSTYNEGYPVLSADRLTLYFASDRLTATMPFGGWKIFKATRASLSDDFAAPELVSEIASTQYIEYMPAFVSADGCRLYVQSMHGNYITNNLVAAKAGP
ncbi:MAG: hypothetical protein QM723_02640 [Myxococcaceae bacterium]